MTDEVRKSISDLVLEIVNARGSVKIVDLTLSVINKLHPIDFTGEEFINILDELVEKGEILELEYVVPNMNYRVKSILFPKDTLFKWVKNND